MGGALVGALALAALTGLACGGCAEAGDNGSIAAGSGASPGGNLGASSTGDGSMADANSSDDGGGDTSVDWCAAQGSHLLCEDFDQGVPGQLISRTYGGGTVASDVSAFVSGGESMWASVPALFGPAAAAGAVATASLMTTSSHSRLQAELQVASDCVATQDGATLATLSFTTYSVSLVATSGATVLVEQVYGPDGGPGSSATHPLVSPIPNDRWCVVVLDVDLSARKASVTLSDVEVLSDPMLSLEPTSAAPISTAFSVGAATQNALGRSPGCHVRVDNVLFDLL